MKVGVIGADGRMGKEVCKTILSAPDLELAFAVDVAESSQPEYAVTNDLPAALKARAKVAVDFTHPNAAPENAIECLASGTIPVIGTSGLSQESLEQIRAAADRAGLCALYIPNFAIGAVLMMRFAEQAAKHMPEAEIVEMHHDRKADAPSGTAIRTAEMIEAARSRRPRAPATEIIKHEGATGATIGGTHVHSVRLPGLVAHQMVLFGGAGETLTIRHDSLDRSSFMGGVLLAVRGCIDRKGLIVGLETFL